MIELLAQVAVEAEAASKVFGLTVAEWVLLLGALGGFVGAVYERLGKLKAMGENASAAAKVRAVIEAVEETKERHPEAARLAKRLARDKATKMGVEVGQWGLAEDVEKYTKRLRRDVVSGDILGPDDPTPDPEATP